MKVEEYETLLEKDIDFKIKVNAKQSDVFYEVSKMILHDFNISKDDEKIKYVCSKIAKELNFHNHLMFYDKVYSLFTEDFLSESSTLDEINRYIDDFSEVKSFLTEKGVL